jgi:uncharacterized protein
MLRLRIVTYFLLASSLFYFSESRSQSCKVLHYTETSGFDHQTRTVSFAMFQQMGVQFGFTIDNDSTGQSFGNLQQYDVVIFSNTSGDNILDAAQQATFQQYINSGGSFIGIHAASDTYRHSTANGTNTGTWDWYAEMLGASVQQNPNHVSGTPVYRIDALFSHTLLAGIPNPWHKAEEYYYWESGYFNSTNVVLQKVEQTVGPNSLVNSYDSARAVTWYKILPGGGKSFYTSLGHAASNYTGDTSFYRLLSNAVLWACDSTSGISDFTGSETIKIYPNPVASILYIANYTSYKKYQVEIYDMVGTKIYNGLLQRSFLDVSGLKNGIYCIRIRDEKNVRQTTFIKTQ